MDLNERLARLESSSRRWKALALTVFVVLLSTLCVGMKRDVKSELVDKLQAHSLEIIDRHGDVVFYIRPTEGRGADKEIFKGVELGLTDMDNSSNILAAQCVSGLISIAARVSQPGKNSPRGGLLLVLSSEEQDVASHLVISKRQTTTDGSRAVNIFDQLLAVGRQDHAPNTKKAE